MDRQVQALRHRGEVSLRAPSIIKRWIRGMDRRARALRRRGEVSLRAPSILVELTVYAKSMLPGAILQGKPNMLFYLVPVRLRCSHAFALAGFTQRGGGPYMESPEEELCGAWRLE